MSQSAAPKRPTLSVSIPTDDKATIQVEQTFAAGLGGLANTASGVPAGVNMNKVTELKLQTCNITKHNASIQAANMSADEMEKTQAFWRNEVYQWKLQAMAGHAVAAQNVGVALYRGELGVPKDEAEACKYFRIAAKAGLSTSMFNLGWAYASGSGVTQSWIKAVWWWKKAASAGHGSAARNLGLLYSMGIAPDDMGNAAVDNEQAFYWYTEAANMNNHKAMAALANCYANGLGVATDQQMAQLWTQRSKAAAEQDGGAADSNGIAGIAADTRAKV